MDETELRKALDGDDTAAGKVMEFYWDGVYRAAYRHLFNEDQAKEIAQETFVIFLRKGWQIRSAARLGQWLRAVAARKAQTKATSLGRERKLFTGFDDKSEGVLNVTDEREPTNLHQLVSEERLLKALPNLLPSHREILGLVYDTFDGDPDWTKIGEILDVKPLSASMRHRRAMLALRRELGIQPCPRTAIQTIKDEDAKTNPVEQNRNLNDENEALGT